MTDINPIEQQVPIINNPETRNVSYSNSSSQLHNTQMSQILNNNVGSRMNHNSVDINTSSNSLNLTSNLVE